MEGQAVRSITIQTLSGYPDTLTPQQKEALDELKAEVGDRKDVLEHPEGESYLLRMLRATMKDKTGRRVFVVGKAKPRLLQVLDWKQENQIKPEMDPPEKFEIYRKAYPLWVWGDKKSKMVITYSRK